MLSFSVEFKRKYSFVISSCFHIQGINEGNRFLLTVGAINRTTIPHPSRPSVGRNNL